MKNKKLPHFKTSEEAAHFWDTHSLKDYIHELEPADDVFVLSPAFAQKIRERAKKRMISIDAGIRAAFTKPAHRKAA